MRYNKLKMNIVREGA